MLDTLEPEYNFFSPQPFLQVVLEGFPQEPQKQHARDIEPDNPFVVQVNMRRNLPHVLPVSFFDSMADRNSSQEMLNAPDIKQGDRLKPPESFKHAGWQVCIIFIKMLVSRKTAIL